MEIPIQIKVDYLISIQTDLLFNSKDKNWKIFFKLKGDRNEVDIELSQSCMLEFKQASGPSTNSSVYIQVFKLNEIDIGKIKALVWLSCKFLNNDFQEIRVYEIRVKNLYRNDLQLFPIDQEIFKNSNLMLKPNLKPGETGVNYAITTHTGLKQNTYSSDLIICIELFGEKGKTKFIPLQHSQLNKQPFVCGKKDVFDFISTDVGKITKVIIGNHSDNFIKNNWFIDNLEIKILNNSQIYNFSVNKNLKPSEEIVLLPMNHIEIVYQVVLRLNEINGQRTQSLYKHLTDLYFIIYGAKGCTKKIYINNFDLKRPDHHDYDPKEKFFEFKSEDVGKIEKINISINQDNNPENFIYIDFIEIKIPSRSEAYKFPIERVLGEYFEDGKCELDLEVWKHPERPAHIDYEILSETGPEHDKEAKGKVYLIIHGDHCRTGKIELNDGNFENSLMDNYEFSAPDVGKITKIEIFYIPMTSDSEWQLESIQIKVARRNEAYKFPIHCWLNSKTNYLELFPWKKPLINKKA